MRARTLHLSRADSQERHGHAEYGEAEVEGDRLLLGKIPPRSKLPIQVCVAAYQAGRMRAPKVQAATSVEQTFLIDKAR